MTWFFLILAGCMEVVGVIGITKVNQSPSVKSYSILVGGFLLSFIFLFLAMKGIAMSTAYAVWTGIGTVGSALVGMFMYGESRNKPRIMFIALIIVSVVALKIVS
jgi:paired small multidrug resistance pump